MEKRPMAVPDFQSLMLPLLSCVRDGNEKSMAGVRQELAEQIGLAEHDLAEKMDSGAGRFANRVAWAKVHLERAGLLEKTRRGWFRIAPEGSQVLASPPERLDLKFLNRYPGSVAFRSRAAESDEAGVHEEEDPATPEETLETSYQKIRQALAQEVLAQVLESPPALLEKLVVDLMLKMGYGGVSKENGIVTPLSGDEGIDGIINEDRLGLEVIYLQAKRWERPVGRPEIQKFVGALHGKRARKGVFICTSSFTQEAIEYVRFIDPKVILIDGIGLAERMIDFNVGVSRVRTYELKRIDSDYFADEA
jgi:restriction system protein